GPRDLAARSGVPVLGVIPWIDDVRIDAEDSLALDRPSPGTGAFDVAVVRFPRISNFTDLDPLVAEPDVSVRYVSSASRLGRPDLVVLPGTKGTVGDLAWLRAAGLDRAIEASGAPVLGICGGEQMMGTRIVDQVESAAGVVAGLGWVETETVFEADKVLCRRRGSALGVPVDGYEIHHGRTAPSAPWLRLDGGDHGSSSPDGRFRGTALHGLFESDQFRHAFLASVGGPASAVSFAVLREAMLDRLADHLATHLDIDAITALIEAAT
ncbi:MAG: cobyric acid synthase CobQ, partial [Acidobacteria bacterium]|nr:cobyric acid synthase CobQ [Acidobacteriota bacterium]